MTPSSQVKWTGPMAAGALGLGLALGGCNKAPTAQNAAAANAASDTATDTGASAESAQTPKAAPEWTTNSPPPPLPTDTQPPIPEQGYIWTPGYWAWSDQTNDYYWTNGSWVQPPQVGQLWTPGFWAFVAGRYLFHQGHWGPHVGFYGGVDYGQGYTGEGYQGGRWQGDTFVYNTSVNNFGAAQIAHQYSQPVAERGGSGRVSFNGAGGVVASPTAADRAAAQEPQVAPTLLQDARMKQAQTNPVGRAGVVAHAPARPAVVQAQSTRPTPVARPPAAAARPPAPAARPAPAPAPRAEARPAARPAPALRPCRGGETDGRR